jgi:hypothetical protein
MTLSAASASLTDQLSVGPENVFPNCASRSFDETLELSLAKLPGEEFPLNVAVSAHASHTIQAVTSGQILFVGLPPGYSVQSCQGYNVLPVATRASSWGAVKQLYR